MRERESRENNNNSINNEKEKHTHIPLKHEENLNIYLLNNFGVCYTMNLMSVYLCAKFSCIVNDYKSPSLMLAVK